MSRWTKTALLRQGKNEISAPLHPGNEYAISPRFGNVVSLEVFLYRPRPGESIRVRRIRLDPKEDPRPPDDVRFTVSGRDLRVRDVLELGEKLKGEWRKPAPTTVAEVEKSFRSEFEALRAAHPRAVMAILRDGERGYDPANPERLFEGWENAYFSSHGPDGATVERAENGGGRESGEIFMRHRAPLFRVDLSIIPRGSTILAARLVVVRAGAEYDRERNPLEAPSMWAVEPSNRPWVEHEVNAYEYARDRFWREVGGRWYGDDPDFLPVYLAHGPGGGKVSWWDFREAVRFWTSGEHPNHGFMLHSDSHDWLMRAWYREAKEVKDRPAVLVIYEPAKDLQSSLESRLQDFEPRPREKLLDRIGWARDIRDAIRLGKEHLNFW